MFTNKKAQTSAPGNFMITVLVILLLVPIIILLFMLIINNAVVYKTVIPYSLEEYILINKFLSSDECFAHFNSLSGEYVPLSMDQTKFNEERLKDCYPNKGTYYALRITLIDENMQTTLATANWDEKRGPNKRTAPQFITLYKEDMHKLAKVIFEIQNAQ